LIWSGPWKAGSTCPTKSEGGSERHTCMPTQTHSTHAAYAISEPISVSLVQCGSGCLLTCCGIACLLTRCEYLTEGTCCASFLLQAVCERAGPGVCPWWPCHHCHLVPPRPQ
jgi:hypothetical protein